METRILSNNHLEAFVQWMHVEEKSSATCEKYLRDIRRFKEYAADESVSKEVVARWKNELIAQGYAVRSINSMLASVNSLLMFMGWEDCKVKNIRLQHQTFSPEEKELTKAEYQRLLQQVRGTSRQILFYRPSVQQASGFQNCSISRLVR